MESDILEQLMSGNSDLLDKLIGDGGEALLDKEILKFREEMGEEEFSEFAGEFFKGSKVDYKNMFGVKDKQ